MRQLFAATSEVAAEAARLRDMHPSDVAHLVRNLPLAQRRQLAEAMEDERLADLLEELPEAEQLRIIEGLDLDRLVSRARGDGVRRRRRPAGRDARRAAHAGAGGDGRRRRRRRCAACSPTARAPPAALMTPDVIILGPTATVAEALAQHPRPGVAGVDRRPGLRRPSRRSWPPTGTYLGVVHFQRLLREPPSMSLGRCVEEEPTVPPDMPEREVAERLAAYNLLAVPVCDEQQAPARRHHRRRRARPHAAGRLAAAARDRRIGSCMRRREDLATPRQRRRLDLGIHYDPDAFGEFSEAIARTFGTARFLVIQTVIVGHLDRPQRRRRQALRWDPYPFILLNLVFSTQAAYAAPLILLAQNRQERARPGPDRDATASVAARTQADTEFLAREIASIRLALADVVTTDGPRRPPAKLGDAIERISQQLGRIRRRRRRHRHDRLDEPPSRRACRVTSANSLAFAHERRSGRRPPRPPRRRRPPPGLAAWPAAPAWSPVVRTTRRPARRARPAKGRAS